MIARGLRLVAGSRDFALLVASQLAAQAGDGIVQVALAKYIVFGGQEGFDLEGARSPDELLRIALLVFIPYTLVSPFVGVLIDRWDRRRLLFVANGLRAAVVGLVALVGIGRVGDGALFMAFLLTLMSTRIVLATKSAALPATLGGEHLVEGNAVSQLGGALLQTGGAAAALLAAKFAAVEPIVLGGAVVYGIGALAALPIKRAGEVDRRATFRHELARVASNIAGGVREVGRTPKARVAIATYFWLRLLWSFTIVGISFVARELLAEDDLVVAALTGGAGAAGAAAGFFSAHRLHDRAKSTAHLVLRALVLAGGAVAILGGLPFRASIALVSFFLGAGFFLAKISLDTLVQEALGDDFRGRAFSLYDIAYNLAWVVAAGAMAILWSEGSEGGLIAGMGVVFLAGVAPIAASFKRAGLLDVERVRVAGVTR